MSDEIEPRVRHLLAPRELRAVEDALDAAREEARARLRHAAAASGPISNWADTVRRRPVLSLAAALAAGYVVGRSPKARKLLALAAFKFIKL